MDGREVYRFATHKVPESIERSAQKASLDLAQIDYYLLHQANSRIITQVAKRLEQPLENFPSILMNSEILLQLVKLFY